MWLAALLKNEMDERRLTQEQIAAATGVSQPAVSKWVRAANLPDPRQALRLAVLLQRDPLDFLGRLWPEFNEHDRLGELRVLLTDLSDEELSAVVKAVRAYLGSVPPGSEPGVSQPRSVGRTRRAR